MAKHQQEHQQHENHRHGYYRHKCHHTQPAEVDYQELEGKLFSSSTSTRELESICMTLAHTPSKQAQELLGLFKERGRATEVAWLDFAIEEGQFHYNEPQTPEEERDFLALKIMQELMESIFSLELDLNEANVELEKMDIHHQAIRELVAKGELEEDEQAGLNDVRTLQETTIKELRREITVKEKTYDQIETSIRTERYKNLDPMTMRDIHW